MGKIIIIGVLLAVLVYYIFRRLNFFSASIEEKRVRPNQILLLAVSTQVLKRSLRAVLYSVGTGILLLFIIFLIAAKFKIALIILPVCLYLIGQFFVFNNHANAVKGQNIRYDTNTDNISIENLKGELIRFNLLQDVSEVKEVRAVQKNNGLLLGYYKLRIGTKQIYIPYLLQDDPQNKLFFDKLQLFDKELETKLFPII
ncbi:hypothetical protein G5B30_08160 [Sphingobacterium sp. SGG-5]|uniref:hypothetical protein n=1 Tax=Sphingobacterium sp. SGG-5 TaxID=2710881 RepID=UPI0013EDFE2B|nr:hypothetical protein [Sphingobacterium sp. SGG-5]NGM61887.1 hypothetical protein [Sphingobacterium sp. SGG-5]